MLQMPQPHWQWHQEPCLGAELGFATMQNANWMPCMAWLGLDGLALMHPWCPVLPCASSW